MKYEFNLAEYSLLNGGISIHYNNDILKSYESWYLNNNYRLYNVDLELNSKLNLFQVIFEEFDIYGMSFSQDDMLEFYENCIDNYKGKVLILERFDDYFYKNKYQFYELLDTLSILSRKLLVKGYHLIIILHSGNSEIQLDKVGGIVPGWNNLEWFTSNRVNRPK